jgi:ribosomal protein S18 acetylase RimI-like enzyme
MTHPLDNPVLHALTGPQRHFARVSGNAVRYPADMSPYWAGAARLAGPGEVVLFPGLRAAPPAGWEVLGSGQGVQLVADTLDAAPEPDAEPLGPADVPAMLRLAQRTKPGPFMARTVEFGGYLGIRRDGELVAMAGERFRPPGWTEISAVCTDPAWRGHGFASRLTRAVAAGIAARGDIPFLHAIASNTTAIRLYKELGFVHRRDILFWALCRPAG